jgi:hypothetical protein
MIRICLRIPRKPPTCVSYPSGHRHVAGPDSGHWIICITCSNWEAFGDACGHERRRCARCHCGTRCNRGSGQSPLIGRCGFVSKVEFGWHGAVAQLAWRSMLRIATSGSSTLDPPRTDGDAKHHSKETGAADGPLTTGVHTGTSTHRHSPVTIITI